MRNNYKLDFLEKLLIFYVILYFVIGYLMNYSWVCKELDLITTYEIVLSFWNRIAIITGIFYFVNGILIIISLQVDVFHFSFKSNKEFQILLYILLIPSFLFAIIFIAAKIILNINEFHLFHDYTLVLTFGEMILFFCTVLLIKSKYTRSTITNYRQKIFIDFIIKLTSVGILNCLIHYMTSQQIINFVNVASNFSVYLSFYNISLKKNRTNDYLNLYTINGYLKPLMILFCCLSFIYLFIYFNETQKTDVIVEQEDKEELIEPTNIMMRTDCKSINLPLSSIILGVIFVAITLVITILIKNFINTNEYNTGLLISAIYPIPFYLLSFFLLIIQLDSMKTWPKLLTNEFMVDKILLWIGASGQIILCIAQILTSSRENKELCDFIITKYVILFFQIMTQAITLNLALDRKWLPPELKTWQEKIFPPIGLLSVNLGFLLFSILNANSSNSYDNKGKPIFMKIFVNGFQSPGLILAVFHRLHNSIIFGRMIIYRNN